MRTIIEVREWIVVAEEQLPSLTERVSRRTDRVFALEQMDAQGLEVANDFQRLQGQLLFSQLQSMGLFTEAQSSIAAWQERIKLPTLYRRWLEESVRVLASQGYLTLEDDVITVPNPSRLENNALWTEWDARKHDWGQDPNLSAQVNVVDATLRALPEILTGKKRATDILFPNSSMALVEGIYKNNPSADYFNAVLADTLIEWIEARVQQDANARLRILEIGAGTGGTSAGLFARLAPYAGSIAEYGYTDISKAFLMHADEVYGPTTPYLVTRLFNVEQPLTAQGIEIGAYDGVIATNVLHATKNIRHTLRNTKAALKKNGVVLLNEIAGPSLFAHLTFGLLEGWWLYEDAALRIPGTPALSPTTWQRVLEGEGFHSLLFPAHAAHERGQQVVVAESDGVIRQQREETYKTVTTKPMSGRNKVRESRVPSAVISYLHDDQAAKFSGFSSKQSAVIGVASTEQVFSEQVRLTIREAIGHALKMDDASVQDEVAFSEYGVDSIVAVSLVKRINEGFGITLPTTTLFDYPTIERLATHIVQEHGSTLMSLSLRSQSVVSREKSPRESFAIATDTQVRGSPRFARRRTQSRVPKFYGALEPTTTAGHLTYHRVVTHGPGSIADLEIVESAVPATQDHEVQIAVHAFSLNFGDLLCVQGLYPTMPPYPFTPGFEVSGTVVAVGKKVTSVRSGDRVVGMMGEMLGGQATLVTCHEGQVFPIAERQSFEEACALPAVAITMIDAFHKAGLKKGERILIQTAAGGTGLIAVQLAKHCGAVIYATAGSKHKLDYLQSLGVPYRINYLENDFEQEIYRLTKGQGVDVVINTLSGDAIQKGLNCLSSGGRYIEIAMTALKSAKTVDLSVLSDNQSFYSVDLRKLGLNRPEMLIAYRQKMMKLVEEGVIYPTISEVLPFNQIKLAYRHLENRQNIGKIIVSVPDSYRFVPQGAGMSIGHTTPSNELIPAHRESIAIIGMSGRFATASTANELWESLAKGAEMTQEVSRWDLADRLADVLAQGAGYCRRGGFLHGIDQFDPLFFNISGLEATYMDPHQRLFLEEAWKALEDAGYAGVANEAQRCGVYVGCAGGDYSQLFDSNTPAQAFWGNAASVIPARISYYLNLQGPAIAVDTACSSSLVAIHLACQGLWNKETELALAGGVHVQCTSEFYVMSSRAGMLSPTGRCHAFDDRADGFVPGEGVGLVVLKRLSEALTTGDHIYGVIRGSGINQDGATNGITAPSALSQERLEREVYETFRIHPEDIQMIEAHGTGTILGDPIEWRALTKAFRKDTEKNKFCAIGSIKTNIGHSATAAGAAGVIKILLSLKHKQIPPSLNYEKGNSHIDFENSPFYVNTTLRDWEVAAKKKRCAAVSSFGFSGTNAHLVIEEAPIDERSHADRPGYLVVLSARSVEQLKEQAERLVRRCEDDNTIDCGNISYTLLMGRKHFNHRLACVARNTEELAALLRQWLTKGKSSQVYVSAVTEKNDRERAALTRYGNQRIEECRQRVEDSDYLERLVTIADLYIQGYCLGYELLFPDGQYSRVSLPTYPFAKERYWVEGSKAVDKAIQSLALHPLLQSNTSDLSEQRFSSTFTGEEFFLSDHVVQGARVLPGVCYLEMARAAVERSAGLENGIGTVVTLQNVVWLRPVVVDATKEVHIALTGGDNGDVEFEVYTTEQEAAGLVEVIHAQGQAVLLEAGVTEVQPMDLSLLRTQCNRALDVSQNYGAFSAMGIEYGPAHRGLTSVQVGSDTKGQRFVLAQVTLPQCVSATQDQYVLHPSVLDSALQASMGLSLNQLTLGSSEGELKPSVPFALERLEIFDRSPSTAWVVVRPSDSRSASIFSTVTTPTPATAASLQKLDIDLCDESGRVCVRMQGFTLRVLESEITRSQNRLQKGGYEHPIELVENSEQVLLLTPNWKAKVLQREMPTVSSHGEQWVLVDATYGEFVAELAVQYPFVKWEVLPQVAAVEKQMEVCSEEILSRIQSVLREKPKRTVLMQVILAANASLYSDESHAQTEMTDISIHARNSELLFALTGLLQSAHRENPKFIGQVIAAPRTITKAQFAQVVTENATEAAQGDAEIRYTRGVREVSALKELTTAAIDSISFPDDLSGSTATPVQLWPWKTDGVYLITGGAGGLGQIFAREIVDHARKAKIILTGRSDLSVERQAQLEELKLLSSDAEIVYQKLDVADDSAVHACIVEILTRYGMLHGVIHSAGVLRDNFIIKKTPDELRTVFAPKVTGTLNLDQATAQVPLDFFILFSSTSGVFGNVGQCDYAAANAFMDRYAEYRNQLVNRSERSGRTLSIDWPLWKSGGMQMDAAKVEPLRQLGIAPLSTTRGIQAFYRGLESSSTQVIVLAGNQQKLRATFGLVATQQMVPDDTLPNNHAPKRPAADLPFQNELESKAIQYFKALVASSLKIPLSRIETDEALEKYGIDSILMLQIIAALERNFGSLSKTLLFEYQDIESLTRYFLETHASELIELLGNQIPAGSYIVSDGSSSKTKQDSKVAIASDRRHRPLLSDIRKLAPLAKAASTDIAIIGISGRYPSANNLNELWENLKSGKDCITEIPEERWDYRDCFDTEKGRIGKSYSKWGGFIDGVDQFDPLFFNISPREAPYMDPQGRLFLEVVWNLLEQSGNTREALQQRYQGEVGVYVGSMYQQYQSLESDLATESATSVASYSSIANRASYFFGLQGPSIAIDTMCSSAALAIHTACNDLLQGNCRLAIAGAVNLSLSQKKYIGLSQTQMIGSHPNSRSFGMGDGYLPAEAVGAVLLKPLSVAIADGDAVLALIKGTMTNHGGRSNGYSVPNPNAQEQLITAILKKANIDPRTISYVEAAANGSALGDPIELTALNKAFHRFTADRQYCAIGSIKSNIGHAEAASGISQLSKVVLQLQHRQLVPSIMATPLNPNLNFDHSPFYLQHELQEWKRPTVNIDGSERQYPRRALINSYGAGGSNVSLLIEEYCAGDIQPSRWPNIEPSQLIVFSAKTPDRLRALVRTMLEHIQRDENIAIADLAYTLQMGREAMDSRLAIVINSRDELMKGMAAYLGGFESGGEIDAGVPIFIGELSDGRSPVHNLSSGKVGEAIVALVVAEKNLEKLALLWTQGVRIPWLALHTGQAPRILLLPTYPFARQRYWISTSSRVVDSPAHRLLDIDENPRPMPMLSTASPQSYIEDYISQLLSDLLALPKEAVSHHKELQEYGIDSIVSLKLMRALENNFNVRITGREMLEHRTIKAIAGLLGNKIAKSKEPTVVVNAAPTLNEVGLSFSDKADSRANELISEVQRYPLSEGQKGLWMLQKLHPSSSAYNIPLCLQMTGALQIPAIKGAIRFLVQQHSTLAYMIVEDDGVPYQCNSNSRSACLYKEDISAIKPDELLPYLNKKAKEPFALDGEPLLRICLLSRSANEHFLLIVVHHIIFDGRSVPLLMGDLINAYERFAEGGEPELVRLAATYTDFVEWEQKLLASPKGEVHRSYWMRQLAGSLPSLTLPADRRRRMGESVEGASYSHALPNTVAERIRQFTSAQYINPAVLFLSVYKVLLHRYTGEVDLIVGMPTIGRSDDRFNSLIGYFVNMVALRSQIDDAETFADFLRTVQFAIVDALDHADYPFPRVVRDLNISGTGQSSVFQVAFTYQNAQVLDLQNDLEETKSGLLVGAVEGLHQEGEYELVLEVVELGEGINLNIKYDANIFDVSTVHRMMDHFCQLLDRAITHPEYEIGALRILNDNERRQLLEEFNATAVEYPQDTLIQELFEAQVEQTPGAVAVIYEAEQLTYGELNERANRLAHYLRKQGVGPDQLVAICVERSVEMIVGLLGILKAGGAYVPLDPSYPQDRLAYMLEDAAPGVLLTQERLRDLLPQTSASVIALDSEWSEIAKQTDANLSASALGVTANHLAYVIYTSGSTGQPKGVMVEHAQLTNLVCWHQTEFQLKQGDRCSCVAGFGFDAATWEIFPSLCSGAGLVFPLAAVARDPEALLAWWSNQRIDVSFLPTPIAELAFTTGTSNSYLRALLIGGDYLRQRSRRFESFSLVNNYGPTESTVVATSGVLRNEESAVHIGRPISNTQIYVLDGHGQPVPIGVNGEIYIGGAGVARGYLNKEALTAERFVKDPFSKEASARLYKTGDIGRWRADGNLEYVGRNDHQVKIRGFRIELGEIESQLTRHAQVKEAVVIAREDRPGEKRLVAYLTPAEGMSGALSNEGLRAHLKEVLPEYMIPSAYVQLAQLPLTPNGKLDRKALPAPELEAYAVQAYEAPQGEIEEALAGIWRELLSVERVGRHDNFFELGGHSLLAMQLLGRIRTVLKIEVPLRTLFEYPVLQDFQKQLATQNLVTLMPIERADRNQALPLSWSQQRLWFIAQLEGAGEAYHIPGAVRLQGVLDRAALQHALDTLVERHEVLRTCFIQAEGRAVQVIAEEGTFALQVIDVSQSPPAEREAAVQRHVVEEARAPFEMSTGPLIRGRLLKVAEQEHVLLITMHHIVSDGWSLGIFIREIGVLYSAYREGRSNPLAALPIQYADYAQWQRQWLVGDRLQAQLNYWQQQLSGAPALLELPTDRPRPAVQRYTGGSVEFALGTTLSGQLKAFSRQQEVTLFMTVYAGFALLLSRLSGQDDIVMGTAMANRQRPEVEGLIGFFVNTLALRVRLSDTLTVRELLNEVREMTLMGYSHQEAPFEQVVEAVRPPRSLSHSPIFQVMLAMQNTPQSEVQLPGLSLAPQAMAQTTAQYDLSLSLQEIGDEMVGSFNYASDLFDRETIERWSHYFKAVLEGMLRDVEQAVGVIPLLSEGERYQLIEGFNATRVAYPKDTLIQELFEAQVEQTPDAVAVVYEEQQLTYQQLNQRANQVAHYLRNQGVCPDQLVAICVERSVEMIVGLLGILKAGGAYVPLDPSYPQDRLAYMLEDAAPGVLLTQERLKVTLPKTAAVIIALDSEWSEISKSPGEDLSRRGLTSNHLAYVIYTSGSTGRPKGVANEHRGVVNRLQWMQDHYRLTQEDRVLQKTPFSFDVSVWELFWPLLNGARLIVARPQGHQDPLYLSQLVGSTGITILHFVPSMLQVFLDHHLATQERCDSLRHVVCSGEELPLTLHTRCLEQLPHAQLHNLYGPTEAAVDVTYWDCGLDVEMNRVPIGRPISNTQIYVLDGHGQPVPIGVNGEIYIGGAGVARGYLNKEALTAERFVKDPFSKEASARLYKTGDIGRWRADGNLEYVGRNDHQVKIRGFRIELGEIESQLTRHAQVKEAVVIAREDRPGEKRLVAYLTPAEGMSGALSNEGLRAHLKEVLPEYMIPSAYVQLAQLPLTPNGKLDRKALPAPELEAYAVQAYEAPQGEIEEALAGIWRELLSVERVGRHDNFFELGGHSLLAMQLLGRIRTVLKIEVPLRTLFEYPVLQDFQKQLATQNLVTLMPIERADRNQALPLSWSQQRLWFIAQLEGAGEAYHIPGAVRLQGVLDRAALQHALDTLVERHEVLRTCFIQAEGRAVQVIAEEGTFALQVIDVSQSPPAEREAAVQRHVVEEARAPFEMSTGPLIRGRLLKVAEQEHVLLITMHHIVSDGWSLGIFIREIGVLYSAYREGRSNPLAALPIQYADYAQWQRQWLVGDRLQAQLNYWQQQLSGAPALLELPTDRPRPAVQRYTGGSVEFALGTTLSGQLKAFSRQQEVTLFMTVYAGFALLLSRLSGQDDIVMGTAMANRQRPEVEGLIGFFVNTLALRVRLSDTLTVRELLNEVREMTLRGYSHQEAPFEQVVEAVRPPRSLSHSPIFQVMLALQNTPQSEVQLPGLSLAPQAMSQTTAQYDLSLSLQEIGDELVGSFNYASDLFDRETIERWSHSFKAVLEGMLRDVEQAVGVIPLLSEGERYQLIEGFNATRVEYPKDTLIQELFEAQVEQTPDAVAVVYEEQQLTYQQLNQRANQVAHYLRKQGVGPDQLVAICVERSVEMIVGLLGILKAGGAYVPLDPSYPQDRLAYMLEDAAPRVVLTQARLKDLLPQTSASVIALDSEWSEISKSPGEDLSRRGLTSNHLAYVIYTSGSTGQPKGVMVEHRSVVNFLEAMRSELDVKITDRLLAVTTLSFDIAGLEIYLPLTSGAQVVVASRETASDAVQLIRKIDELDITLLQATPATWRLLLEGGWRGRPTLKGLCGGEALSSGLARQIKDCVVVLRNLYGPTETTIWSSGRRIVGSDVTQAIESIGRPISNTRMYILDSHGQPMPMGVNGEIYIGGAGVARGYLNKEALTAERFVKDPYSKEASARLYKTGDIGRWRADGNLEYVGRNDHQIKIRGFRIELGEIETQLCRHAQVKEAVVLAREDRPGEKRLVAYLTPAEGMSGTLSNEDLRTYLKGTLPEYMIPSAYVRLEQLPLTPNGKLDRKALPAPELEAYAVQAYEAPQGEIEEALAGIWRELLSVERVGRHDNFFELGGHSLLAVQMMGRIEHVLDVQVSLRELFESPQLSLLSEKILHIQLDIFSPEELQELVEKIREPKEDCGTN